MIVNHETKVIEGSSPSDSIPVKLKTLASLDFYIFYLKFKDSGNSSMVKLLICNQTL